MRRLIFITQQLDPEHPALAATVEKVAALARRVDELVVLADGIVPSALPPNARASSFAARSQAGRGGKLVRALAREVRPRPVAVVAHMAPIYAVIAAPVVRPLGIPLALWFTHWKRSRLLEVATRVSTQVLTVDRRTFPLESPKVVPIGHGIAVTEFPCTVRPDRPGLAAISLGRTSPAKGLDVVAEAVSLARADGLDVRLDHYGPSLSDEEQEHRRHLEEVAATLDGAMHVHDAVSRSQVPELLAGADCLVNNMRAGATDKVVFEAAASCVPVLASNDAFDSLLAGLDLSFPREDPRALANRFASLARLGLDERTRIGGVLRERVVAEHSVDAWADKLLAAVT